MNDNETRAHTCAKCGKAGATYFSPIAIYSDRPDGEWRCAQGNSHGVSSREAWACHTRAQVAKAKTRKTKERT